MKIFNVDEYLEENGITIELNKKKFHVKDIPADFQEALETKSSKEVVKKMLGCSDDDITGYGEAAFAAIVNQVTSNLFPASSQNKV